MLQNSLSPHQKPAIRIAGLLVLVALASLVLIPGCGPAKEDSPDVIILQSGRLRGNVVPLAMQKIAPLQHYQYLAGYVNQVRAEAAENGAEVILVDLGDSLAGSFASHATDSRNMVEFFNALDYDVVALGNLDSDVAPETLENLNAVVICPFETADGKPAIAGSKFATRLEKGETAVDVIGNFYGDTSQEEFPGRFPTTFGGQPVQALRDYRAVAEALGTKPDGGLRLFSWMKFESPDAPPEKFLQQLRDINVDAVMAHRIYSGAELDVWSDDSLHPWNPPISENILRNNGGFTLARLDLKRDGNGWRVIGHQLVPMTANSAPADPKISALIGGFTDKIARADRKLEKLDAAVAEEEIFRMMVGALTQIDDTDAVAYSRQSVRSNWPAGSLTASRVFNSLPWTTEIVQLRLTPDQINSIAAMSSVDLIENASAEPDESGLLTVTTSRFFASLIARELGLPADAIRPTQHASEFDYFIAFFSDASPELPDGWRERTSAEN